MTTDNGYKFQLSVMNDRKAMINIKADNITEFVDRVNQAKTNFPDFFADAQKTATPAVHTEEPQKPHTSENKAGTGSSCGLCGSHTIKNTAGTKKDNTLWTGQKCEDCKASRFLNTAKNGEQYWSKWEMPKPKY